MESRRYVFQKFGGRISIAGYTHPPNGLNGSSGSHVQESFPVRHQAGLEKPLKPEQGFQYLHRPCPSHPAMEPRMGGNLEYHPFLFRGIPSLWFAPQEIIVQNHVAISPCSR